MSKMKLLLDVISDLRELADSIQAVADAMLQSENSTTVTRVKEDIKPAPEKPKVTLEDVRAVLAEKSRNNMTAKVKELLGKYGANKLSEVDPSMYEELLIDAEALTNE